MCGYGMEGEVKSVRLQRCSLDVTVRSMSKVRGHTKMRNRVKGSLTNTNIDIRETVEQ